ncbi:MAG TPA: thiosulfate oxidation carrier complex protein SoxZ [Candidatus Binatia bacterium]
MMAQVGKVTIRVPPDIKRGDVVRIRSLVIHPMEIVQRQDGKPVDKNYLFIHQVIATYNGREILRSDTTQSISENPSFSLAFRPTEPGTFKITFLDTHGGKYEGTAEIKF